jgi:protein-tyrosine phosphatase
MAHLIPSIRLTRGLAAALAAGALLLHPIAALALDGADVQRPAPNQVTVTWQGADPVDVYVSGRPDASIAQARRVARADRQGVFVMQRTGLGRPYFILKDEHDRSLARVAERLLPLERGSNFRDVGGYPAAGGKHVRWGLIYRSGATPMLTEADFRYLARLGLAADIDLRSTEERQIAPDRLPDHTGALYLARDYPGAEVFAPKATSGKSDASPVNLYRSWLVSLAPQFRDVFHQLLKRDGAVTYHCSAGQDRSGVATALVLSALGVPRDVILADYHLSTQDRRPENEMPHIDPARYPGNVVAAYYVKAQASGKPTKPRPLYDASGVALLQQTFDEIDTHWGSVDTYLDKELGVNALDIARLRAAYLE